MRSHQQHANVDSNHDGGIITERSSNDPSDSEAYNCNWGEEDKTR